MKEMAQWINWRHEERDSKVTKVPICPHTGELAAVDRPETWGTYEEAVRASKEHGHDGVGFVFTEEDPYGGIDLDKCRDPDSGEIQDWAREHDLPCDDQGHVQFPDVRIEYDINGRDHTLDVEVMTPHYRGAHGAAKSGSEFRLYFTANAGRGRSGGRTPSVIEELL